MLDSMRFILVAGAAICVFFGFKFLVSSLNVWFRTRGVFDYVVLKLSGGGVPPQRAADTAVKVIQSVRVLSPLLACLSFAAGALLFIVGFSI